LQGDRLIGFMWIGVDYQVLQYEWYISVTAEGERLPLMLFEVSCQLVPCTWVTEKSWQEMQ